LLVTLALFGGSGCGSKSLVSGDGGNKTSGPDGPLADLGAGDPAACGCQVEGSTLTISMECYCKQYDCTQSPFSLYCSDVSIGVGCGILEVTQLAIGGPEKWVYNDERTLIGVQLTTDDSVFTCPTDPKLQGYMLRAGTFPLDGGGLPFESCASVADCPCVDGKMACTALDAGTRTAPDAATP
jgi:hypothetical protein